MSLQDFCHQLNQLAEEASSAFSNATEIEELEAARIEFLGAKNGRLKSVQKLMGTVPKEEKPKAGQTLNQVKTSIQDGFEEAKTRLVSDGSESGVDPTFDATLPGLGRRLGRLHPISQTINELTDIMGRLGFSLAVGPEIEDEHHNFNSLNIPNDHPARDTLAGQGDGCDPASDSNHFFRPCLSSRYGGCDTLSHVPSDGRVDGGSGGDHGGSKVNTQNVCDQLSG